MYFESQVLLFVRNLSLYPTSTITTPSTNALCVLAFSGFLQLDILRNFALQLHLSVGTRSLWNTMERDSAETEREVHGAQHQQAD